MSTNPNTVTEMLNTEKQDLSNQIKTRSNSNRNRTHSKTIEQTLTQKNECNDYKENYVRKEGHITIYHEPKLGNSHDRNWKINKLSSRI